MKKAFFGLGRDEDLIAFLSEVSRVHPQPPVQRDSLFELARILLDKQRVDEAKRVLDQIIPNGSDPKVIQKLEGFRFEAEYLQPGMPFPKLSGIFAGKREQIAAAEQGKHVVLFWRASCLPSKDLYWWLASDLKGSAVIAVHLGKPRAEQGRPADWSPSQWVSLIDQLDFQGVARHYNVHAAPTAFVIDVDGLILPLEAREFKNGGAQESDSPFIGGVLYASASFWCMARWLGQEGGPIG